MNEIKLKTASGVDFSCMFTPEEGINIKLETDETPLKITVESPTKKTSVEFVGGREKRG